MFVYSLFALYYSIRNQAIEHFNIMSPSASRATSTKIPQKEKAYEKILHVQEVNENLPKEDGYDLHLNPEDNHVDIEQKRRLHDAETLNRIHNHMFSTVFIQRLQQLRHQVKDLAGPGILDHFHHFQDDPKSNAWSGELWEKFQQEGEMW